MTFKKMLACTSVIVVIAQLCACSSQEKKKAALFYNTYAGDEYTGKLRNKLDNDLKKDKNIVFENYNGNNDSKTRAEQIEAEVQNGADILIVNMPDNSSKEEAGHIADIAKNADIPLIFFGKPVEESVLEKYDKSISIGADLSSAEEIQGQMMGKYLLDNYELTDLNQDGKISYVMLRDEDDNSRANSGTLYSVDKADTILAKEGKPAIEYYDESSNENYFAAADKSLLYEAAYSHMVSALEEYNDSNNNMIELVIANNDHMAIGALAALREAGYNNSTGSKIIPVFGIGATSEAQNAIYGGMMVGSVRQNPEHMAKIIEIVCTNILADKDKFKNIDKGLITGRSSINIPYEEYFGHKNI